MRVKTKAGGRIHFGLVDLTGATPRRFGGLGAVLAGPLVRVTGTRSSRWEISGLEDDDLLQRRVLESLRRLQEMTACSPAALRIDEALPRHHGLGSGTTTTLCALAAADAACGTGLSNVELVRLSGRGGASGTGVNGFWGGGWILDCGQAPNGAPLPSGSRQARDPSMLLQRISPPAWTFDVYMPPRGRCFSGSEEESIFREAAAGGKEETLEALAVLYHGLVPALLSHDLDQFGVFMHEYQSRGLKKVEIARQHPSVSALMRRLRSVYPCVAMSSMGPAVVGIRETSTDFPELPGIPIPFVTTSVDDEGAQILWDV